jgi:hypothetical protein
MFAQKTDPTTLRQGDIITDVVFPLARMDSPTLLLGVHKEGTGENVTLAGKTEQIGRSHYLLGQIHVVSGLCAVLSQCCDVDSKQDPPPPSLLLCRVLQVPEGLRRSKQFEALKANVDPYGTERPHYRLFYLGNLPDFPDEYLVDYGLCMTVAWRDYNQVLRRKILEMDDLTRSKFRVKAGAYFGRATSEEVTAGIADPWHTLP